jgi:hypothetical protein
MLQARLKTASYTWKSAFLTALKKEVMNVPEKISQLPDDAEIAKVIEIVEEATTAKEPLRAKGTSDRRLDSINSWIMSHSTIGFVTIVCMAFLAGYTKSRPLADASLVLAVFVQAFGLALLGVAFVGQMQFLRKIKKAPYSPFFHLLRTSTEMDLSFVYRLASSQAAAIQYVLAYYKYERSGFEKRCSILVGSLERIGVFPAIAGLILLVASLTKISEIATWAVMFGPVIFGLYLMNLGAFQMMQKMDRSIAMLEFCVQSRK